MEKAAEQGSAIAAAVEGVERQWGSDFSGTLSLLCASLGRSSCVGCTFLFFFLFPYLFIFFLCDWCYDGGFSQI